MLFFDFLVKELAFTRMVIEQKLFCRMEDIKWASAYNLYQERAWCNWIETTNDFGAYCVMPIHLTYKVNKVIFENRLEKALMNWMKKNETSTLLGWQSR